MIFDDGDIDIKPKNSESYGRDKWRKTDQESRWDNRYPSDRIKNDRTTSTINTELASQRQNTTKRLNELNTTKIPNVRSIDNNTAIGLNRGQLFGRPPNPDMQRYILTRKRKHYPAAFKSRMSGSGGGIFQEIGHNSFNILNGGLPGTVEDIRGSTEIGTIDFGSLNTNISRKSKKFGAFDFNSLHNIF
jgi:hypothetical protein